MDIMAYPYMDMYIYKGYIYNIYIYIGFPGSSAVKESTCNAGNPG